MKSELQPDHFKTDGTNCSERDSCALSATHSRLREAHRHFHEAERHYSDPDAFMSYLNACIQSLRNVTFVLQKQKDLILGFDDWYGPWQDQLRNDRILRWIVDARNEIVKRGDLETCSVANVAIIDDYSSPPRFQFPFPPFETMETLSCALIDRLNLPEIVCKNAILRVERRWVAKGIPGCELLQVLAHAYTTLAYLIADAHRPLNQPITTSILPRELPGQPLPCMTDLDESRVLFARFRDKYELILQRHEVPSFELPLERAREHYGSVPIPPEERSNRRKSSKKRASTCSEWRARSWRRTDTIVRSFSF